MRIRLLLSTVLLAAAFLIASGAICAQDANLPHLEKRGAATQLIVDGKPFLMLSGELYNSSSSSLEYMKPLWPRLAAIPLNTVVTPLSWELIEPAEGKYDFTLVDGRWYKPAISTSAWSSCGWLPGRTACTAIRPGGSSRTPNAFRASCCTTTKPTFSAPLPAIPMPRAKPTLELSLRSCSTCVRWTAATTRC